MGCGLQVAGIWITKKRKRGVMNPVAKTTGWLRKPGFPRNGAYLCIRRCIGHYNAHHQVRREFLSCCNSTDTKGHVTGHVDLSDIIRRWLEVSTRTVLLHQVRRVASPNRISLLFSLNAYSRSSSCNLCTILALHFHFQDIGMHKDSDLSQWYVVDHA